MKTLNVETTPTNPDGDITGTITTNAEALQQRITQRLKFRRGTSAFAPEAGTDSIIGHQTTTALAARIIVDAIRDEGGDEITGIETTSITNNPDTRTLTYTVAVATVYDTILEFSGQTL